MPGGTSRLVDLLAGAVALIAIGNLGRPALLHAPETPVTVNDVIVVGVLAAGALACLRARVLRIDVVAVIALLFAGVALGAAFPAADRYNLAATEVASGLMYLVRWVAYFGVYVVVLNTVQVEDAGLLPDALERGMLWFAAFGIVQAIFIPGFAQKIYPTGGSYVVWDVQGHRLVSTQLDPNFAGALIMFPLLIQIAKISYGVKVPFWRPLLFFAAVLCTVSRSTILSITVGGCVILGARGLNRRLLQAGAGLLLLLLPGVPALVRFAASYNKFQVDDSALDRLVTWQHALTVFADNPVIGVGFNLFGYVGRAYGWDRKGANTQSTDGGLLFVAVMTGLVGLALYVTLLALNVRRCRRLWRNPAAEPVARATALGVAAATVGLTVHSVFVNTLLSPFLMETLWVLWGSIFLYARAARRAREGPAASRPDGVAPPLFAPARRGGRRSGAVAVGVSDS